ncbi:MAG: prepilin-type N-terminal cleavage/methylation domain-containing protein [Phycisphaerales bacterium]|nr:MAG: prepilin-type N-terminal cleavage/methylation domain-containing protein [Phycisphaerales bacterium]
MSQNSNAKKHLILDASVIAACCVPESAQRFKHLDERADALMEAVKRDYTSERRPSVPSTCVPKVSSIFAKYRLGQWKAQVKKTLDDLRYWRARLQFHSRSEHTVDRDQMHPTYRRPKVRHAATSGFSLLELVIVIAIIGIIVAIAAPRIGNLGSRAEEAAIVRDLAIWRNAIERYRAEHIGTPPLGLYALTAYTNDNGIMSFTKTEEFIYGPYIHRIPPCPSGSHKGATGWAPVSSNPPVTETDTPSCGWLYHSSSGSVWINDAAHFDK